jgi:hypothetical protein
MTSFIGMSKIPLYPTTLLLSTIGPSTMQVLHQFRSLKDGGGHFNI